MLDNERCILCSRCVRFTREISKSNALGIIQRGDASLVRAAEDRPLDADPYSDNVIDICPVGALLSRSFLYKARVWYLEPTPSVCPGCARGCTVQIWHRKPEWKLNALDPRKNVSIERVTPLENPAVNGPWICNKGRDLAAIFERPRAEHAMQKGGRSSCRWRSQRAAADRGRRAPRRVRVELGLQRGARRVQASARRALQDVRQAGLAAAAGRAHRGRPADPCRQEPEHRRRAARCFPRRTTAPRSIATTDLVLVWGEGFDFARVPPGARIIFLNAYTHRRTRTPTFSFRSASRPSVAATTPISKAP